MELLMLAGQFVAMVFGIAYGITIFGRVIGPKQDIPQSVIYIFAFNAAAFITMQWLIPHALR